MEDEALAVDAARFLLGVVIGEDIAADVEEGTRLIKPSIEAYVMSE